MFIYYYETPVFYKLTRYYIDVLLFVLKPCILKLAHNANKYFIKAFMLVYKWFSGMEDLHGVVNNNFKMQRCK